MYDNKIIGWSLLLCGIIILVVTFIYLLLNNRSSHSTKIAFVTYDDRSEKYQEYTEIINQIYCDKYKITYYDFSKLQKYGNVPPWWRKVFFIRDLIKENNFDYIIWMDKDAAFADHQINVNQIIQNNPTYSFFISYDPVFGNAINDVNSGLFNDLTRNLTYHINTGVFIVKNDTVGNNIIDLWIEGYNNKKHLWSIKNKNTHCKKFTYGKFCYDGKYYSDSGFEQGCLSEIMRQLTFSHNEIINKIKIFPYNILANMNDNDIIFVAHKMGKTQEQRELFFKNLFWDILSGFKPKCLFKKLEKN